MTNLKLFSVLFLVIFAVGCSTISVQSTYNKSTDFTKLKTYGWLPIPKKANIDSRNLGVIKKAINAQLASKGLKATSGDPDFLIAAHVEKKDKKLILALSDHGYSHASSDSYGGDVGVATLYSVEGNLSLDFIDPQTRVLIWRGVGKEQIDTEWSQEELETKVNQVAREILKDFPPSP
ncbi:DUF4136 domain-containing protein [Thermodesulfobacteriota bacterium]